MLYTLAMAKRCVGCDEIKDESQFSPTGKGGKYLRSRCKPCNAASARKWAKDNAEHHRETRFAWDLRNTYGTTPEAYQRMLDDQGGVCAICDQDEPNEHGRTGTKFRLSVDHCHETGRVRGALCQKCNRAIGLLGDDVDLLKRAINYLERGSDYRE